MKKNFLQLMIFGLVLAFSNIQAQSNQYLHFDRVDDYVETPNASQYIANSDQISMAGWFYTDQLAYGQGLMSFRGGGTGTGEMYLIQLNNGTIECRLITTNGFHEHVAPAFTIVPQTWQHIAWIYDGSSVTLYVNGVVNGSAPATGVIQSANRPFTIGKTNLGGFNFVFGGRADEVSVWSKALTQQEIQDMMDNELNGDEPELQLYYKMNQGVPGEDNTSISKLDDEVEGGDRNADLINFGLMGDVSNFGGVLDNSFQAITFPQIPNKLITDDPFQLQGSASSGLPVSYEIVSGPASVSGDMVTLNGTPGEVVVKASQGGDGTYDAAEDLFNSFQVIDPSLNVPFIDVRSPLTGDVFVPELKAIQLAAISNIEYPELFSVTDLKFEINGDEVIPTDWGNEHYTDWWTPPAYGNYSINITATNNFGASAVETVNITVTSTITNLSVKAVDEVWADINNGSVEVEAELPSYLGAFDNISGFLTIGCPPGGCDPWDRISGLEVKTHEGEWVEIIRYITPYGVACNSEIDLTDFMSALQGKIRFRVYLGTLGNGFLYSLDLDYTGGVPEHPYSSITELWRQTYNFGNPIDLQPVPNRDFIFPDNTLAAKLKLVSSGHGWGDNNTGNAAEFHEDTHYIWVDGVQTFAQHNWLVCNPNPDGCSPQNGTWFHNRAGWCPGAIAPWFDYDMEDYVNQNSVHMGYVFDEDYTDFCNADNPNCVSGVTCTNCNDGFNPHLIVSSYLITSGDVPLESGFTGTKNQINNIAFQVFPNPTSGILNIEFTEAMGETEIRIFNTIGQLARVSNADFSNFRSTIDVSDLPKGVYSVEVLTENGTGVQRVIVE